MNYDKSKFERGKLKMVSQPIFYVEGKKNKIFYQSLEELSSVNIENGGNCNDIRKRVHSQTNSYGIIDRDYSFHTDENIFPINFYSIENISLIYINELDNLRTELDNFINFHTINVTRRFQTKLKINSDISTKRVINYELELSDAHDIHFLKYIRSNIVCSNSFSRYSNVKEVVDKYAKFYKSKNSIKIKYITDLIDYLPSKSIDYIFDHCTKTRLMNVIDSLN